MKQRVFIPPGINPPPLEELSCLSACYSFSEPLGGQSLFYVLLQEDAEEEAQAEEEVAEEETEDNNQKHYI